METIDDRLAEIDRMLRMEVDLPLRLAEDDSLGSQEDNRAASEISSPKGTEAKKAKDDLQTISSDVGADTKPRSFDGDGTSLAHATGSGSGLVTSNEIVATGDNSAINENSVANNNASSNEHSAASGNVSPNDNVAANDSSATNDNAAANESIETVFDPDSVDLDTFPRCRHCFLGRRRCDGRTPCDKCRQRRCPGACRPVTVELLRQHSARAERILELARRNGAGS